ncbi:transcription cofactor vestigial-like protein 4 isoform X1 [Onthophagus taurus]|uniref:transcription cofactor vestigial-like protein 4 isoform X1 n=1 Tax=Onthophagus taurus TaxID=166361 RepID=UPI0039BDFCF4
MELLTYVQELLLNKRLYSEYSLFTAELQPKKYELWQPWLDKDDSSKQNGNKQLPTTKWKRDRRSRNEYSRKSDPKLPENFGQEPEVTSNSPINPQQNGQPIKPSADTPLDMTVRQRGQPPSYSQTINNPGYRSSYRPSVVTNQNNGHRDDLPSGISMCDPIIDEHFRRSLGKDYIAIFSNNNVSKEIATVRPPPAKSTTSVIELMDTAGLSVDDHFAKALGDTWLKLNKKESEIKSNNSENSGVVTVSYS